MDLSNNYFNIKYENENKDDNDDFAFDIETQSTFASQLKENEYYDMIHKIKQLNITRGPKEETEKYMKNRLQNNKHFTFPDRQIRNFNELDSDYYDQTQKTNREFEHIAKKKYQNIHNLYNFPYENAKSQNEYQQQNNKNIYSFMAENIPGPYNDYWISDDLSSQERTILGGKIPNNAYRLKIDSSIIDPQKRKLFFQKYV
jgi:hypothetical protein